MADGVKYPYVMGTDKFVTFLKKIPDIGLPDRFQLKNLKSLGYTSSNDERFLPTLRFINFIDSSGVPSSLWREARGNLAVALAQGIKAGYTDLFSQYANAYQKDDEALRTFFSVHSGTGKEAVAKMVSTFKAMCGVADFQSAGSQEQVIKKVDGEEAKSAEKHNVTRPPLQGTLPVSINIQLQLPADPTGEIYDKFFAAMKKHLPVGQ